MKTPVVALVLAVALGAARVRAEAPAGSVCKARIPKLNTQLWRKQVKSAASAEVLAKLLGPVLLLPDFDLASGCSASPHVSGGLAVDRFTSALVQPGVIDEVLQLRADLCGVQVRQAVLLHPLDDKTQCVFELPFVKAPGHRSFAFITSPLETGRSALLETSFSDDPEGESSEGVVLWDFQDGAFEAIWSTTTRTEWAHGPSGGHSNSTWQVMGNTIEVETTSYDHSLMADGVHEAESTESHRFCLVKSGGKARFEVCP